MYGWDSYFILLGLVQDGRNDLARGMVENFFFEIGNYGAILNANRTYFFTRSQPPFLSSMIREVYEHPASGTQPDLKWLARAYDYAQRDYGLWTSAEHQAGSTGLARYHDLGEGPVPEMADDSSYYPDVIRWLLAHPVDHPEYLVDGPTKPTAAQAAALAKTSCDIAASHVCALAVVDGHRLSAAYYQGDRAMRESGFDTSFRFGPFSGSTDQYAPVCLNSLLFKYEKDMAHFATLLGRTLEAKTWSAAPQPGRPRSTATYGTPTRASTWTTTSQPANARPIISSRPSIRYGRALPAPDRPPPSMTISHSSSASAVSPPATTLPACSGIFPSAGRQLTG
jgi:alpha,alpha-trehalase